ncbi:CocE/NonD family hydrolase [Flavitalea sp. BT771]|uniref:CocE/NonD family hydrolase n=1 Tax=Flavitalea sp. BT771 TaxID=3063329 RepID=UPI0026E34D28|nr:CocE/NonD family hydrolase [Flavitalea sp. BT771]MDO6431172.1 CocE/NonD family hydrolase [Flavitalea sp. BT771]MDV6220079.1 CocE/NonD family hydrolase [Flavitalea sp. BT771]
MRYLILLLLLPLSGSAQNYVKDNYTKREVYIPMRDGTRLFTSIYIPKDDRGGPFPFLMERTPYSVGPYGDSAYRGGLGPNAALSREPFIFVYQDVRGRYMSEGNFEEMTPHKESKKAGDKQTDESSDTWDTVDWLLKNIRNNNGRVGMWGISYPGFYASAALPDAHPAIKAVSPQAPVTDEFIGDDANHNGAFFLLDNFDFDNFFDVKRPGPVKDYGSNIFRADISDAYEFFLHLGPLKNTNKPAYFNHQGKIWNEYLLHSTYDDYWRARNIRTHLKNIRPAVLVVGGWFDAEDMFGALRTYEAIERQSPQNSNYIVMGPWTHGGWAGGVWDRYGILEFGQNVNEYYHQLETAFFNHYLKDSVSPALAEATVFETGVNQWKHYDTWPPKQARPMKFHLRAEGKLSPEGKAAPDAAAYDEYVSDPSHPVPYVEGVRGGRDNLYIVADQRFAAQRPDVLTYSSDTLPHDLNVTGRLKADIFLSSTGTDADLVVKVIDVLPDGYQRLVRGDVFRCKFRNSFEQPEPLTPGKVTEVVFDLNEIAHTFRQGHRLMVQIQSSWFPLVDMNPQTFVNIPTCGPGDFRKATIRVYHDPAHLSHVVLPTLN